MASSHGAIPKRKLSRYGLKRIGVNTVYRPKSFDSGLTLVQEFQKGETMKLASVLPQEFFREHATHYNMTTGYEVPSPAAMLLDVEVIAKHDSAWPGKQRNVNVWWELADGHAVGWNENPSRGWSFPVITL